MIWLVLLSLWAQQSQEQVWVVAKQPTDDLNELLAGQWPIVGEWQRHWILRGTLSQTPKTREVLVGVDLDADDSLVVAHLRDVKEPPSFWREDWIVFQEDSLFLLHLKRPMSLAWRSDPRWMTAPLSESTLKRTALTREDFRLPKSADARIQQMVDQVTLPLALGHWQGIITSAVTRYSTAEGCQTASETVAEWMRGFGLDVTLQPHTSGHAPNVVGVLEGKVNPSEWVVMVGHLDDLPSSGDAPGANDNASGSATVTLLAEVLSQYAFEKTIVFLAVTGEEFNLFGSTFFAEEAFANGASIAGVLNADMTGWAGDGLPAQEDLDLNYNAASQWLADLFAQAASEYQTGCVVNRILCPTLTASDHAPFWANGYPAICGITDNEGYCGQGGHYPYYHRSTDTLDHCGDPAFFLAAVRAYLATAATLAVPLCGPPDAPAGLMALNEGDNQVRLTWDAIPSAGHYRVKRTVKGCQGLEREILLGEVLTPEWIDTTLSGGVTYGYQIQAIDGTGFCSSSASCVEVTVDGVCQEAPLFTGVATVENLFEPVCGILLSWEAAETLCDPGLVYAVYRSLDPDTQPSQMTLLDACVQETYYLDQDVAFQDVWYYLVRAEGSGDWVEGPCGIGAVESNSKLGWSAVSGPLEVLFADDLEQGSAQWFVAEGPGNESMTLPFSLVNDPQDPENQVWFCENEPITKSQQIQWRERVVLPPQVEGATLRWRQAFDTEARYDGGVLEVSLDSGQTWGDIEGAFGGIAANGGRLASGDYTQKLAGTGALSGRLAWTGKSQGMEEVLVLLDDFAGQTVQFRWLFASDASIGAQGWWLDDFQVRVPGPCETVPPCRLPEDYWRWPGYSLLKLLNCEVSPP